MSIGIYLGKAAHFQKSLLEGVDIATRTIDAGVVCLDQGGISKKASEYNKLYYALLRQPGSFYSFSEDDGSFLLFNPERSLLFYIVHY